MRVKIQKIELEALRNAVKDSSQLNIARKTGVAQHSISEYISGKTLSWSDYTRDRLYPVFEKYLPEEFKLKQKNIRSTVNQSLYGNINQGNIDSDLISKKALMKKITSADISAETKIKFIEILNDL